MAYVFGANIYYRDTPESQDIMVSTSGRPGVVFNGVADWVYEVSVRILEFFVHDKDLLSEIVRVK